VSLKNKIHHHGRGRAWWETVVTSTISLDDIVSIDSDRIGNGLCYGCWRWWKKF